MALHRPHLLSIWFAKPLPGRYVTYRGTRGDIEPDEFKGKEGATLHLWSSDDPWTSFTAHSDPDNTYSGTLSLKTGGFKVR